MPSVFTDSVRAYRQALLSRAGEQAFQVVVAQTDLFVLAARDLGREVAAYVSALRRELETFILLHPDFRASFAPIAVGDDAPAIARDMAEAAARFGVGPFAAVAGAFSQAVADAFAAASPEIVVENGGDIYLRGASPRTVALLARPVDGARLALTFAPSKLPAAVCASSATVGHSLSLGEADMVTVVADRGAVADAAATALGNMLRTHADLPAVLAAAEALRRRGVRGVFAQLGEMVGVVGDVELAAIEV